MRPNARIQVWVYSFVYFNDGLTGEIKSNGGAGLSLAYFAHAQNYNGMLGNPALIQMGPNTGGNLLEQYGGVKFW